MWMVDGWMIDGCGCRFWIMEGRWEMLEGYMLVDLGSKVFSGREWGSKRTSAALNPTE
jgi:hypothetical protein